MKFEKFHSYYDNGLLFSLKALRKLHLGKPASRLLGRPLSEKSDMTYSRAQEIMQKTHPKITSANVLVAREESWNKGDEHYNLTIIVPAYNCAEYVVKCLRSLISQVTEYSWTAIVVDDGSTDNTLQRLRKFRKYPNIKIIAQENKGVSSARNTGLRQCSSDYVMFLDSDDLLAKNAIQNLLNYAYLNDLDIVEGNYLNLKDGKTYIDSEFHKTATVEKPLDVLTGYPWMKVFKTELFRSIQYPEGCLYEDSIIAFLIYPLAGKCGTIEDIVYYYRRHGNSFSFASRGSDKSIETYYIAEMMYDCISMLKIDPAPLYDLFLSHVLLSGNRMAYCEKKLREAVFVGFCVLHDKYYSEAPGCSQEYGRIRECLLNRDFGKFDLYSRLS